MISPARKTLILANLPVLAATILATPNFQFAALAAAYPFSAASTTYGLTLAEYNHLFIPDVANIDGICGPDQAPTLTSSSAARVADNMTKFVAYVKTQF